MDYSYYLKTNTPNFDKLQVYGFRSNAEHYVFKKNLSESGLCVIVQISADRIDMRVLDRTFNDDYIPFGIKDNRCTARFEAEAILEDIIFNCFDSTDIVTNIIRYMDEKYGCKHEEPWDYLPGYYTFKTPHSQKWYAIIMHLKRNKIGLEGENMIDIINVKINTDKISGLIDNTRYFPSYHMNKKNWITVLLDKDTNMDMIKDLIDDSFNMVEKPEKTKNRWLVPANPKYYDIDKAISESPDKFIWKQSNSISCGDIIYLYIAAPISAIVYKCEVLKTNIPYKNTDKNIKMKYVIELRLLMKYNEPIALAKMREFGVMSVRGSRSMPDALIKELDKYNK